MSETTFDCIVFGGGLGGMVAALTARHQGLSVALCEKSELLGGTLAISSGTIWVPGHGDAPPGDAQQAEIYLAQLAGKDTKTGNRRAFLSSTAEAVKFLADHTEVRFSVNRNYPDYRPDIPGAALGGRAMSPLAFDASAMGAGFSLVRPPMPEFMVLGGMMVARDQIPHLLRPWQSIRSSLLALRVTLRYLRDRLTAPRGRMLYMGNALAARCIHSLAQAGVTVLTRTTLTDLIVENGRVTAARVDTPTGGQVLTARRGIVLATGGFAADPTLRAAHLPDLRSNQTMTLSEDTGDGLRAAMRIGGQMGGTHQHAAFLMPASTATRRDGSHVVYPHIRDRPKPGLIAINGEGRRFTNEANSYHDVSLAILAENRRIPDNRTWLICDHRFVRRYGIGFIHPVWQRLGQHVRSGYLKRGATLLELAQQIGVASAALTDTVERQNVFARAGVDGDFGKGSNALNQFNGDVTVQPNPCLAAIETAPFYAVSVEPTPIGTSLGLVTDGDGAVLAADDEAIPGLFAVGSDSASIMAGTYPGPGVALGPSLVFGFRAGRRIGAA